MGNMTTVEIKAFVPARGFRSVQALLSGSRIHSRLALGRSRLPASRPIELSAAEILQQRARRQFHDAYARGGSRCLVAPCRSSERGDDVWRHGRTSGGPAMGHARLRDRRSDRRDVADRTEHPQRSLARIVRSVNWRRGCFDSCRRRHSAARANPLRLIRRE